MIIIIIEAAETLDDQVEYQSLDEVRILHYVM